LISAVANKAPGYENIASNGSLLEWLSGLKLYEKACGEISDDTARALSQILRPPRNNICKVDIKCRNDIFQARGLTDLGIDLEFSLYSMCHSVNMEQKVISVDICRYWNHLGMGKIVFDPITSMLDDKTIKNTIKTTKDLHKIWISYSEKLKSEFGQKPAGSGFETLLSRMDYVAEKTNVESAIDALLHGVPAEDIIAS
jgi:hypothetical protein